MLGVGRNIICKTSRQEYTITEVVKADDEGWFYVIQPINSTTIEVMVDEEDMEERYFIQMALHSTEIAEEHKTKTKNKQHRRQSVKFF